MNAISDFFVLDIRTMLVILVLGNLLAMLTVYIYWLSHKKEINGQLVFCVIAARFLIALAFFLTVFRGQMPDILSVNIANTCLLIGFFFEATSMVIITQYNEKQTRASLIALTLCSIIVFNIAEYTSSSGSLRVTFASLGVFGVMVIPSVRLMFAPNATFFKRFAGFLYCFFTSLLLPRALHTAKYEETDIFSEFLVQSLTFLSLVMILVFSLSVFLLLMKEESDAMMRAMATTDSLSGLSNRQNFLNEASKNINRLKREKESFTLLFIDIDHFKKVNDTFGHGFGDKVIQSVAKSMRNSVRPYDLVARFGGEEFVIMLMSADREAGKIIAERLRGEIADVRFEDNPGFTFTVSIGMTVVLPGESEDIMDFVDQADQALYQAKQTGRNKTVIYEAKIQELS